MSIRLDRRRFLAGSLTFGGLTLLGLPGAYPTWAQPRFTSYPFSLGVASGDPHPDGVVLWTRLAPDPLRDGGMPRENVEVEWRIASDETMRQVVQEGKVLATPDWAHSVHVEVHGLEPARWYWYQFRVGAEFSPLGRTRTVPAQGDRADRLRFAFASCQHYEHGYYTAYRHLAEEDLDVVFHLGDYIYEMSRSRDKVRSHGSGEPVALQEYRNRYALYKSDRDLQAAHAAFPWIVTWDDHEVENNWAGPVSQKNDPVEVFLKRIAAAAQAYYEHMPLRRTSLPSGPDIRLYRRFTYGDLAAFHVLDTRSFRTDQPCGDGIAPLCPEALNPEATILGAEQERWLYEGLDQSRARWNVIPQQVMIGLVDRREGPDEAFSMDKWTGYDASRRRFLDYLAEHRPSNPVVLTGDNHSNWVIDLKEDGQDMRSPIVGTEFVGTSISSSGDGVDRRPTTDSIMSENPVVKFYNAQRGYVRCEIAPGRFHSDYRILEYVTRPDAPITTRASFVVEDERPGAVPA